MEKEFFDIGYHIVQVLISDIAPDDVVREAINEINSQERMRAANKAKVLSFIFFHTPSWDFHK